MKFCLICLAFVPLLCTALLTSKTAFLSTLLSDSNWEGMATAAALKTAQKLKQRVLPLYNRVLIKRFDPEKTTKGGIVLPEINRKMLKGTVIAVGPGTRTDKGIHVPMSLKVGDNVLLPDYGGTKIEMDEQETYYLFREGDILAKIE